MNIAINTTPFNYQNEIKIANSIFDNDEAAGESHFKKASAKNKSLKQMTEVLNGLRYDLLAVSLVEAALSHPEGKTLVETLLYAFINTTGTTQNIDLRNKASFDYFQKLKDNLEYFDVPAADVQDYKNTGFKDPSQVEQLVNLANIFKKMGSISDANSVFASALMKMHPTHQQLLVRAYRNAMVEITARSHVHGESVDSELLKIAMYAASCGEDIAFPYI